MKGFCGIVATVGMIAFAILYAFVAPIGYALAWLWLFMTKEEPSCDDAHERR